MNQDFENVKEKNYQPSSAIKSAFSNYRAKQIAAIKANGDSEMSKAFKSGKTSGNYNDPNKDVEKNRAASIARANSLKERIELNYPKGFPHH